MLNGKWRGQELGSGTGVWSMSEQVRAGTLKLHGLLRCRELHAPQPRPLHDDGHRLTMASMVEALGVGLPGNAAYPAVDGRRNVIARNAGRRIVEMVHEDQTIGDILTREAFENAIRTLAAIGGSTNAVIHLIAIAGRLGVKLTIDDFERLASELPCLVNLQPSGEHLMEDFCYAGGLPAVMKEIAPHAAPRSRRPPAARPCARTSPTRRTSTRASSRRWRSRSRRTPASPCCAATWRRAAR